MVELLRSNLSAAMCSGADTGVCKCGIFSPVFVDSCKKLQFRTIFEAPT